ncbi:NepR family anti-sigma factor [Sphingomonas sp. ASV193]|uniref:NepR family anti-sigma factor n=1 Tax=Sphingomonas sp. ASV193 TaxID=3144405 RepID=UPI0032E8A9FA
MGEGSNDQEKGASPETVRPGRKKDRASPVGRALRSVYDDTLREDVPDDFMDLLKKLG